MPFGNATDVRDGARRRHFGYEATLAAVLDAARAVMREEGVGGLTMHAVARRVGMKTPSLYTYVASKHALYDALFLLGMRAYRARVGALAAGRDGFELLGAVMLDYMRFADEHPELYALLFERPVPGFVPSAASMAEATGLLDDLYARMDGLAASGAVCSGLGARETGDLFIAVAHGLTSLKRANEPEAAVGGGRFAGLVPAAVAMLERAWAPARGAAAGEV